MIVNVYMGLKGRNIGIIRLVNLYILVYWVFFRCFFDVRNRGYYGEIVFWEFLIWWMFLKNKL